MKRLLAFWKNDDGPTAVEYAVMLALIIGVCFASVMVMTAAVAESFNGSGDKMAEAMQAAP